MSLILYCAPDNASFPVRMVLEELGLPYRNHWVDRRTGQHKSPAYLLLNPAGLIPVLETPEGPISETAAILLWLVEHSGRLGAAPGDPDRGRFLSRMLFLANGLHALLRGHFYPTQYVPEEMVPPFRRATQAKIREVLDVLEGDANGPWLMGDMLTVADYYLAAQLRWLQLYPTDHNDWFVLSNWPKLAARSKELETRPSVQKACKAEGMGPEALSRAALTNPSFGAAF